MRLIRVAVVLVAVWGGLAGCNSEGGTPVVVRVSATSASAPTPVWPIGPAEDGRGRRRAGIATMPNFRHRLTKAQQREYDRSNAVRAIKVHVSPRCARAVHLLGYALERGDRARTTRVAQVICDELCVALRVPSLRVDVKEARPSDQRGELHGLYVSAGRSRLISVWMFTAKRGQVVAYKTFLRTLLHEMVHHLDYQLLDLDDSFTPTVSFSANQSRASADQRRRDQSSCRCRSRRQFGVERRR
jgi:hypothetical protein